MTNLSHLRRDFPILRREDYGHPVVFLDSAASAQKPVPVLESMDRFYRAQYANVHRGAYKLSQESTEAYEDARRRVARFLNAGSPDEIIFTKGTTTALNGLASSWGIDHLEPGDRIVLSLMEHHANVVPWQLIAKRTGAELVYIPLTAEYELDLDALRATIDQRVKVVSLTGMSNVLGTIPPMQQISEIVRAQSEAILIVDGAQLVPHLPVDVQTLGADFLAFSAHKMLGPTGIGVLWGKPDLLEEMEPWEGGGEMIATVGLYESTWAPVPQKFEAGTPPIAEAVGLAAAVHYLEEIGMEAVRSHDLELTAYALDRLSEVPDLIQYGPTDVKVRGGVISFTLGDVHPHDIATILDSRGISVRAGHHCAKPLMADLGVAATARASFHVYNSREDVDALVAGLHEARSLFGLDEG
ncbi:MAG TPA: cysteine desulfurase [Acidimicrobiia bacterium]|nr:cysteine desulfurase [Acidimicrobiia bacterium]